MIRTRLAPLMLATLLGACGDDDPEVPALSPGFEAGLTEIDGCSDVFVYAGTPEGDVLLWVWIGGSWLLQGYEEGVDSVTMTTTIPEDPEVAAGVDLGTGLLAHACNDASPVEYERTGEWQAVSGTISLSATLTGETWESWDLPAEATVTATDLVLQDVATGEELVLDSFTFEASVGWFPG